MEENIPKRLEEVLLYASNGQPRFEKKFSEIICVNYNTFNQQLKGKRAISLDTILHILEHYPEVSSDWLLFGKGNMLYIDNLPPIVGDESEDVIHLRGEIDKKDAEIDALKLKNLKLQAQIEYLEERNTRLILNLK